MTNQMTPDVEALLKARYGAASLLAEGPWSDAMTNLLRHRSVRAYTADPISHGVLERLIAAAQSASTSSNAASVECDRGERSDQ